MLARQHGFRSPHLTLVQRFYMNWLTLTVLGAVAAWFEYSYQRSRHKKRASSDPKLEEKNSSESEPVSGGAGEDDERGTGIGASS